MRTLPLVSLALTGALLALPAATQVPDIGVAASITNKVDGLVGQQTKPVVIGDRVFENEVIRTGTNSKGQLLFRDETALTIGPDSEITLDKFVYNGQANTISLNATKGVFRFISGSAPKQAYEIKTPSATVGVRGTILYFALLPDGTGLYYLGEGGVVLNTLFGPIEGKEGEIIVIRPGAKPEVGKLKPWQKALFAAVFDPDKTGADLPGIPGMPDKGDQLRNLLRDKSPTDIFNCYTFTEASYCSGASIRRIKNH
jgi:hypothetical protein